MCVCVCVCVCAYTYDCALIERWVYVLCCVSCLRLFLLITSEIASLVGVSKLDLKDKNEMDRCLMIQERYTVLKRLKLIGHTRSN